MLDFDYISRRETPSVSAIVYSFASGQFFRQFWFGGKEILIPVRSHFCLSPISFFDFHFFTAYSPLLIFSIISDSIIPSW